MKDQTKTPFRAEAWAKNPMLTSSLLSVPEGNKRRLSEEDHDRNKKATSIPLGQSLLTSKTPTHLGGFKTIDFSSLTANRLLSNSAILTSNPKQNTDMITLGQKHDIG